MGVGEKYSAHPLIGRGFLGQRASLGYDANDLSLKLEGFRRSEEHTSELQSR